MRYDQYLHWRQRVQGLISTKIEEMRPRPSDYVQVLGNAIGIEPPESPEETQNPNRWAWVMFIKERLIIVNEDEPEREIDTGFGPWGVHAIIGARESVTIPGNVSLGPDARGYSVSQGLRYREEYVLALTSRVMTYEYLNNTLSSYWVYVRGQNYFQEVEKVVRDPSLGSATRKVSYAIQQGFSYDDSLLPTTYVSTYVDRGISTINLSPPALGSFYAHLYQILIP